MAHKVKQTPPPDPAYAARRAAVLRARYATIHDYAIALTQLVHHKDPDGREIGYDYGFIHRCLLRKFPFITIAGPHKGNRTKMPFKELQKVTGELNRIGIKLPFRPRRRKATVRRKPKKKSSH